MYRHCSPQHFFPTGVIHRLSRGPCWVWAYTDWLENRALSNVDDHRTDFSRLVEFTKLVNRDMP